MLPGSESVHSPSSTISSGVQFRSSKFPPFASEATAASASSNSLRKKTRNLEGVFQTQKTYAQPLHSFLLVRTGQKTTLCFCHSHPKIPPISLSQKSKLPHDLLIEPVDPPVPAYWYQLNLASLSRLKPHSRFGGYIQPIPSRGITIKGQGRISLSKVIM